MTSSIATKQSNPLGTYSYYVFDPAACHIFMQSFIVTYVAGIVLSNFINRTEGTAPSVIRAWSFF